MVYYFFRQYPNIMMGIGAAFVFILTAVSMKTFMKKLPTDGGREFAVDGTLSKGKPRGAGIIFTISFILGSLLFSPIFKIANGYAIELGVYLVLVFMEMLTGYLDDASNKPWGRIKKGLLDLFICVALAYIYIYSNGTSFQIYEWTVTLPEWLLGLIIVAVCWFCINATNCADGVDGLSGTLFLLTLLSFLLADFYYGSMFSFEYLVIFFTAALAAYLWFNAGPSLLLMGDAGSRAMGVFICITALKSGHPLLLFAFAFMILLDGGIGLFKVMVIKVTRNKNFMKSLRTPIHDHVRKNLPVNWSNTQCVMRFAILQIIISVMVIYVFAR